MAEGHRRRPKGGMRRGFRQCREAALAAEGGICQLPPPSGEARGALGPKGLAVPALVSCSDPCSSYTAAPEGRPKQAPQARWRSHLLPWVTYRRSFHTTLQSARNAPLFADFTLQHRAAVPKLARTRGRRPPTNHNFGRLVRPFRTEKLRRFRVGEVYREPSRRLYRCPSGAE